MNWGDYLTFEYGKPVADKNLVDGLVPVFGTNGQIGTSNLPPLCKIPSFIVGRKGAYRGVHYSSVPFSVIDTGFFAWPKTDEVDLKWAYYKFLTYDINRMDSGSAIPSTDRYELYRIPIELPPKDVQHKVVQILDSFESKIKLNTSINQNLTELARTLFKAWFIDYEPFGGSVPSDWNHSTLGQIAYLKTDSWSPVKNPDVVVEHYSIPAFDAQNYPVFENASGIKSNKYILNSESVMISKLNPDTKRIWRPLCLSAHPVCSTEFIVYEAKKQGQRDFIYSIIDSAPFLNYLCSHTTGSTNSRQRATPKSTMEFSVCLPSDSIIEDFCQIVTPIYDSIASNVIENQSLAKLRDTLLPRLMSGELDISELEL